jgi:hypothetical protein
MSNDHGIDIQSKDSWDHQESSAPLPRTKRKRNRTREERGLPQTKDLKALAKTYLDTQHRLWPELVGTELPSKVTDKAVAELAAQFRDISLSGELVALESCESKPVWDDVASAYVRLFQ